MYHVMILEVFLLFLMILLLKHIAGLSTGYRAFEVAIFLTKKNMDLLLELKS